MTTKNGQHQFVSHDGEVSILFQVRDGRIIWTSDECYHDTDFVPVRLRLLRLGYVHNAPGTEAMKADAPTVMITRG
jgi:hypothetical protein